MKEWLKKLLFRTLGRSARYYLERTHPMIIGINGSVGKTSCRMIIFHILKQYLTGKKIYTSPKNFNGELGMSLSILGIEEYEPTIKNIFSVVIKSFYIALFAKKKYDIVLLEYGIDHPGEMSFLLSIAKPDIGVVTRIDTVHNLYFGDPILLAKEESLMAKHTKEIIFLDKEDIYTKQLSQQTSIDLFTYSSKDKTADIHLDSYEISEGTTTILGTGQIKKQKISFTTNLFGTHNAGYIMIGITIADILNHRYHKKVFSSSKENFDIEPELQPGRFSVFKGIHDSIIVDSTYNAAPLSMKLMIEETMLLQQRLYPDHKLFLVLGDMRELGNLTEKEHRDLGEYLTNIDCTISLVGPEMEKYCYTTLIAKGWEENRIKLFLSSQIAGNTLKNFLTHSADKRIILFKGSQNTIFLEEAIKPVLANHDDETKLTRQSKSRLTTKKSFFGGI